MAKKLWARVALAFLMSFTGSAFASDSNWLLGNWIHTFDPDGDAQSDRLSFSDDGKFVTTEIASGRQIGGLYRVTPGAIKVDLVTQQGKVFMKLDLTYDEKKDRLYYKSDSTGNTSYYTKEK
jgi:hypothetical protein